MTVIRDCRDKEENLKALYQNNVRHEKKFQTYLPHPSPLYS